MSKFSAKNKIIIGIVIWLGLTAGMFMYLFHLIDTSNAVMVEKMDSQRTELSNLQAEQDSFLKAKSDLEAVEKEQYQPDQFFSKDVTLVNELRTLEALSEKYNLVMTLSGISGTVKAAPAVKSQSGIVSIPYTLSVTGQYADIIKFVETLEHLNFITNISTTQLGASGNDQVNAVFAATLYLKK